MVLARGDVEVATWPLARGGRPDLAVVDGLARLTLAARRSGYSIRLRDVGEDLSELLDLVGLREVVSGVEAGGQAEEGEQVRVEKVVVPDDPVA